MWKLKRNYKKHKKLAVGIAALLLVVVIIAIALPAVDIVYAKETSAVEKIRIDVYSAIDKSISTTYSNGDEKATAEWVLAVINKALESEGMAFERQEATSVKSELVYMLSNLYDAGDVVLDSQGTLSDLSKAYVANIAAAAAVVVRPNLAKTTVPTNESLVLANALANGAALKELQADANKIVESATESLKDSTSPEVYEAMVSNLRKEVDALRTVVMTVNIAGESSSITQEQLNTIIQNSNNGNGNGNGNSTDNLSSVTDTTAANNGFTGSADSSASSNGVSSTAFSQYETSVAQKFETINQLQSSIQTTIKELQQNTTTNVSKISTDVSNVKAEILEIHKSEDSLSGKISRNAEEILAAKEGIESNLKQIEESKNLLDKLKEEYTSFVGDAKEKFDSVNASVADNANAIKQANKDREDADNALTGKLESTSSELNAKLEDSNSTLNSKLETTATELGGKITDTTTELTNKLTEAKTELGGKITDTTTELTNKLTETKTELGGKITDTTTELTNKLTEAKTELGNSIASTNTTLESYNSALSGRLQVLESSLMTSVIRDLTVAPALPYSTSTSYGTGDCVLYNNKIYKAVGSTTGKFDQSRWIEVINGYCWTSDGSKFYVDFTHDTFKGAESVEISYGNNPDIRPTYEVDKTAGILRISVNNPDYTEINHIVVYYKK